MLSQLSIKMIGEIDQIPSNRKKRFLNILNKFLKKLSSMPLFHKKKIQ